jgi:photosystem II stability/assembly factor-like uncharacterized protein
MDAHHDSSPHITRLVISATATVLAVVFLACPAELIAFSGEKQVLSISVVDVAFIDDRAGWVTVSTGQTTKLFRTDDAGTSWSEQRAPEPIRKLYFLNKSVGWVVTHERLKNRQEYKLYATHDGGANWSFLTTVLAASQHDANSAIIDFFFLDEHRGWFLGRGRFGQSTLIKSDDGGKSVAVESGFTGPPFSSWFSDKSGRAWLIGPPTLLGYTGNGSSQWDALLLKNISRDAAWFRGLMLSDGVGFIVGHDKQAAILKTVDGGQQWAEVFTTGSTKDLWDISFWDSANGCAIGNSHFLYCTHDRGATWELRALSFPRSDNPIPENTSRLIFLNGNHAYLVANRGRLYETRDGAKSWTDAGAPLQSALAAKQ